MPRTYTNRITGARHRPARKAVPPKKVAEETEKKSAKAEEDAKEAKKIARPAPAINQPPKDENKKAEPIKPSPAKEEKPLKKESKSEANEKPQKESQKESTRVTRIIALVNQKGGVGKTTCAMNIGAGLMRKGKSVLFVDADQQGSLTLGFGIDTKGKNTLYEVLKENCKTTDAIIKTSNGSHIIPSDLMLARAEAELALEPGRDMLMSEALAQVAGEYDYILIDCPPALSMPTVNALSAATEALIIVKPEFYSIKGVDLLEKTIQAVKKRVNNKLRTIGIVINMYDARRKAQNQKEIESIRNSFKEHIFSSYIRNVASVAGSPGSFQNIFEFKPKDAEDFESLVDEIIEAEEK
ncbi:MAG: AAA family ATPase [Schwartzia sp.]|nr:AAA family ATPase [Schwartzia sp. (in: firmicutes)]